MRRGKHNAQDGKITSFEPVTREDLRLAHGIYFVDVMLAGSQPTGFGLLSAEITGSTRRTVGSMVATSSHAYRGKTIMFTHQRIPSCKVHRSGELLHVQCLRIAILTTDRNQLAPTLFRTHPMHIHSPSTSTAAIIPTS